MRIKILTAVTSVAALLTGVALPSTAQSLSDLDGNAFLFNPTTKQFLGNISSDRLDERSICNSIGDYGSRISDLSLLNRIGDYGSQISDFSAYNPNAQYPPVIVLNNWEPIAVVSVNPRWEGIHPGALFGVICGQR